MSTFAIIRPDAWNFPLLLHVLGAMAMVGGVVLASSALLLAWRDGSTSLVRLGHRALLFGTLPAWFVMRGAAEWIADKENLTDSNDAWIGIGFQTADAGFLLLVVSTVLTGLATRRSRDGRAASARASAVMVSLLVVAYVVAIWAMTTKPA